MIPSVEKIEKAKGSSFIANRFSDKYFNRSWHFHPEIELLLITKGYGRRVVGDSTEPFEPGDFVLLAGNVPHAWFSDPVFFRDDYDGVCESVYVQFKRDIFGTRFIQLPEMVGIQQLLSRASRGLKCTLPVHNEIRREFEAIPEMSPVNRLLSLIRVLDWFFRSGAEPIVSVEFEKARFMSKSRRISAVHDFVMNNYMREIDLADAAKLAGMNVTSFCRFFKAQKGITFSQYLKEVRIDFAQQLLVNTHLTSNQIGFECGYDSVSYFNQSFKSVSGMSPLEYRRKFKVG